MIIPTFHAFGPKADTANAFLGGQRLRVQRESIAAEAAQAAARIQLGRETLQQRAVEAELEAKTRQEIASRNALKQQQDAEIEKSYNLTKLGMDERKLQAEEAMTAMRLAEGARSFDASQNFNRIYQQRIAAGDSEEVAQRTAARSSGPETKAFGELVGGGNARTAAPVMNAATKSRVKLIEQEIGENRKAMLKADSEDKLNFQLKIRSLTGELNNLLQPPSNASTAAPAAPQEQQWQVNPDSLPYGAPKNPMMFMGTPPTTGAVLEPPRSGSKTNRVGRFNVISDF